MIFISDSCLVAPACSAISQPWSVDKYEAGKLLSEPSFVGLQAQLCLLVIRFDQLLAKFNFKSSADRVSTRAVLNVNNISSGGDFYDNPNNLWTLFC